MFTPFKGAENSFFQYRVLFAPGPRNWSNIPHIEKFIGWSLNCFEKYISDANVYAVTHLQLIHFVAFFTFILITLKKRYETWCNKNIRGGY